VRGQILQIREEGYIQAARLLGAPTHHLVLRHMIPNTLGVILVTLTFAVPARFSRSLPFVHRHGCGRRRRHPGAACATKAQDDVVLPDELIARPCSSALPCWRSICLAMACATPWMHGCARVSNRAFEGTDLSGDVILQVRDLAVEFDTYGGTVHACAA